MIKNFNRKLTYPLALDKISTDIIINRIQEIIRVGIKNNKASFSVRETFGYKNISDWESADKDIRIIYKIYRSMYEGFNSLICRISNAALGRLLKIAIVKMKPELFEMNRSSGSLVYIYEGENI